MEKKAARGFGCTSKLLLLALAFLISQYLLNRFKLGALEFRRPDASVLKNQANLKVYVAEIPREFNHGLLESYWDQQKNSSGLRDKYPENPLLKQHSAEFWLLRVLESPEEKSSSVTRVWDPLQADVIFVPFFAALSAQMQLRGSQHGIFTKRVKQNPDFDRQRRVVEMIKNTPEWRRSNGMDHVFVLADPMAMWHFRSEICSAIFLVVDFGGWYLEDAKSKRVNSSSVIQHTQVSPIKDVIVPHTHLLPTLQLSGDRKRTTLLYFRGARHRHRKGMVRDRLWRALENEAGVVLEEGLPDAPGLKQATAGMRKSEFCLSPAGDTPSSCRLYDAIASLCIPVIVSDDIQLPFEGFLDYDRFAVFVSTQDAIKPGSLVHKLRSIGESERHWMRLRLAEVQKHFEYDADPASRDDGAVSLTWMRIHSKLPALKEAIARYKRNTGSNTSPAVPRCHCVS